MYAKRLVYANYVLQKLQGYYSLVLTKHNFVRTNKVQNVRKNNVVYYNQVKIFIACSRILRHYHNTTPLHVDKIYDL